MRRSRILSRLCCLIPLFPCILLAANDRKHAGLIGLDRINASMPVCFVENTGQFDGAVAYYVHGSDRSLFFTPTGITIVFRGRERGGVQRWTVRLAFMDANPHVIPRGEASRKTRFSIFKGSHETWRRNLAAYGRLVYTDLWPGIDLVYSGTEEQIKYEFRVSPGADPSRIRLAYEGAEEVRISPDDTLVVTTPLGSLEDLPPEAFQEIGGERIPVPAHYSLKAQGAGDRTVYSFEIDAFDSRYPLILDPAILVSCYFLQSDGEDVSLAMAADEEGFLYFCGHTDSAGVFPVKVGPDLTYNGGENDTFVAKLDPLNKELVYCGFIGGTGGEYGGTAIAVDKNGSAYVVGNTTSDENSFPVKVGPSLTFSGASHDGFIAKVTPGGDDLVYCGFIGGTDREFIYAVAVDDLGRAFVGGGTYSDETSFPVTVGPDTTHNGLIDAFVACINPWGTGYDYCGYIGGEEVEVINGICLDSAGNLYVTGETTSDQDTFPVNVGPDLTYNSTTWWKSDGFVAKVNPAGTALVYCGYIGGTENDEGSGIAVDAAGRACVAGQTDSPESSFPVLNGPDLSANGFRDGFVARVMPTGAGLEFCGYLGGDSSDKAYGIALDRWDNVYLTGVTHSTENSFPVLTGPDLTHNGCNDAFVARVNGGTGALDFCGYIGWEYDDIGRAVLLTEDDRLHVLGYTFREPTFGMDDRADVDGFIAFLDYWTLDADSATLPETGGAVNFALDAGLNNAHRDYLLLVGVSGGEPGFPLPGGMATLPLNWDVLTDLEMTLLNTPLFANFMAKLSDLGRGAARLEAPALPPGYAGTIIGFAYCLNHPFDFASNRVEIKISS
jgi:hypothetical protein